MDRVKLGIKNGDTECVGRLCDASSCLAVFVFILFDSTIGQKLGISICVNCC